MRILSKVDFAVLDEATRRGVVGRAALNALASSLGIPRGEVDASIAFLRQARLVAPAGSRPHRRWRATPLWVRRADTRLALSPHEWSETATIRDLVRGAHAAVYADLTWWVFQQGARSKLAKSRKRRLFCGECLDDTGEFVVITRSTYPSHSDHRLGAFYPVVRVWRRT